MPRRYKLIKTYPNSVELGSEVDKEWDEYGVQFAAYPEYWQEIKEEPKVWFGICPQTWNTVRAKDKKTTYREVYYKWFETEKERDQFVLDNKPQFTGKDMKEFAKRHFHDDWDIETSFSNFMYDKNKNNGTN